MGVKKKVSRESTPSNGVFVLVRVFFVVLEPKTIAVGGVLFVLCHVLSDSTCSDDSRLNFFGTNANVRHDVQRRNLR